MEVKKINVGIAGYGYSAKTFHIPYLLCNDAYLIKKIYIRNEKNSVSEIENVTTVYRYTELLTNDIDLIVLCTPNQEHYWMAKEAIERGKNIVIEKPMTTSSSEALELYSLAKKNGVNIYVFQNRRYDADFLTVQKLIRENALGEILDYECHYDRYVQGYSPKKWKREGGQGVNILYDLGVHLIDQAVLLFGKPQSVYADFYKQRRESPLFDRFTLTLYYETKKVVLAAGEVVHYSPFHFLIQGTNGTFIKAGMDPQEKRLKQGELPTRGSFLGDDLPENYGRIFVQTNSEDEERIVKSERGNYAMFYNMVSNVLYKKADNYITEDEIIMTLKIIEAAEKSAMLKRRIDI